MFHNDEERPPAPAAPLATRWGVTVEDDGPNASETYARWHEEIGWRLTTRYNVQRGQGPFRANSQWLETPGAALIEFDFSSMTYTRDAARIRADDIDVVAVQLNHAGGLRGRFGNHDVVSGPGTALFISASQPGVHVTPPISRGRMLHLPRAAFGAADPAALHGRMASGAAVARLDAYFGWLLDVLPQARASAADRVQAAITAVVRATFDGRAEPELQASGALDGLIVQRLRRLVSARGAETGLDAETLARELGVSRASLYRATAPYGGVMELVWAARLEAAHAALTDIARQENVGQVAAAHGFSTVQHFSRRFRDRYGFNPSDLRPRLS